MESETLPETKQWFSINHYPAVKTEVTTFDGEFVGYVMIVDCHDYMFIESLHVRPKFRHKGFGKILLEQCLYGNHQKPFVLNVEPFDVADNGLTLEQLKSWYMQYGFRSQDNPFVEGDNYLWLPLEDRAGE